MRFIQYAFIFALTCSINSCGFIKTVYNKAPEALSWWLDDYFDFTHAQKSVLNPALHQLHDWHRQHQLPSYITTFQDLQSVIAKQQLSAGEACEKLDHIKSQFSAIQLASIPIIIDIAPMLTDKQVQYFHSKLDKRALKWKSEWWQETPEQQMQVRLEKIEDFAEKVYGNLNKSQHAMLQQNLAASPVKPALSYAEILRRNADVEQIVIALQDSALSAEDKTQRIKAGFERLQNSPNLEYQAYANQIKQRTCDIIANLHGTTTTQQKQHANDWLQDYIDQFSSLSAVK